MERDQALGRPLREQLKDQLKHRGGMSSNHVGAVTTCHKVKGESDGLQCQDRPVMRETERDDNNT